MTTEVHPTCLPNVKVGVVYTAGTLGLCVLVMPFGDTVRVELTPSGSPSPEVDPFNTVTAGTWNYALSARRATTHKVV
jgi:hypothetical protein